MVQWLRLPRRKTQEQAADAAAQLAQDYRTVFAAEAGQRVLADMLALYATGSTYTDQVSGGATGDFGDYLRTIAGRDDDDETSRVENELSDGETPDAVLASKEIAAAVKAIDVAMAAADAVARMTREVPPENDALVGEVPPVAFASSARPTPVLLKDPAAPVLADVENTPYPLPAPMLTFTPSPLLTPVLVTSTPAAVAPDDDKIAEYPTPLPAPIVVS